MFIYKFNFHTQTHQLPNETFQAVELTAGVQFTKRFWNILYDYSNSHMLTRHYSCSVYVADVVKHG